MNYFYSTQPLIAWCLNRHFYRGLHYVYVAPFYPYRLPNPKSSNPLEIYRDLYHPWRDRDDYDRTIGQLRIDLRKGVRTHARAGLLDSDLADQLLQVCDTIDIKFFYPIVYRVDIDALDSTRLRTSGSGVSVASVEYLITDLRENEFDVLFYSTVDSDLQELWELPVGTESAPPCWFIIPERGPPDDLDHRARAAEREPRAVHSAPRRGPCRADGGRADPRGVP